MMDGMHTAKLKTKPLFFAVTGHPVAHSLSPAMHNAAYAAAGLPHTYLAVDVVPGRLRTAFQAMRVLGFGGANVTVPLKEEAFRLVDKLDPEARLFGSVNTIRFTPRGLHGYSTDGYGFETAVREDLGLALPGKAVTIIGAGGGARAVALTCARRGVRSLVFFDAFPDKAETLRREIHRRFPKLAVSIPATPAAQIAAIRTADLAVNATPIGMKAQDVFPFGPQAFRRGLLAFDLVYVFPRTAFMRAATAGGARAVNGLGMLLHQGARAFEIWTGCPAPLAAMRGALGACRT